MTQNKRYAMYLQAHIDDSDLLRLVEVPIPDEQRVDVILVDKLMNESKRIPFSEFMARLGFDAGEVAQ